MENLGSSVLIFPCVASDGVALLLLLWLRKRLPPPADSDVIEGEFRREDDLKLPRE